jgi:hypothetical protein
MKSFVATLALATVAMAAPEADPALLYSGLGYAYTGLAGARAGPIHPAVGEIVATRRGLVNARLEGFSEDDNQDGFVDPVAPAAVAAPVVAAAPAIAPYTTAYHGFPYAYGAYGAFPYGRIFKREAEAKAEADPALLYSAGLPYAGFGYGYSAYAPYAYGTAAAYAPYSAYGYAAAPYHFGAYGRFFKREAEAEADAYYGYAGLPYAGFGMSSNFVAKFHYL